MLGQLAASLAVAATLAFGSCDTDPEPPDPPAPPSEGTIQIPSGVVGGGGASEADPLGAAIEAAAESEQAREEKVLADATALGPMLNNFWSAELSRRYQLTFDVPERYEYYRDTRNEPCGGDPRPMPQNAYYCNPEGDEYIAFDLDWFQQYLVDHPGGATTFLILAHEWGHAVQDTWVDSGGGDVWDPGYRQELNADCLAGVFLAASIRDGAIVEEAGDAEAMFGWLYEAGASPWLDPGTHGTRDQRLAAFSEGFSGDTDYCRTTY